MKKLKLAKVNMTTKYEDLLNAKVIPILSVVVDDKGNRKVIHYAEKELKNATK